MSPTIVTNNVAVVDGATKTTNTINAGSNPYAVAINQVTNKVYVPNMGDNTVTVIDAANGAYNIHRECRNRSDGGGGESGDQQDLCAEQRQCEM